MASEQTILTNVMDKLDELSVDFGLESTDELKPCLNDTLREMGLPSVDAIVEMSDTELYVEIRTEWYALHRFRNRALSNYKYGTGNNGLTVDKSMIDDAIREAMDDLDAQFRMWRSTKSVSTSTGVWDRSRRAQTRLTGTGDD